MKQFTFDYFYNRSLSVSREESEKVAENYNPFYHESIEELRENLENYAVYVLCKFCDGQLKSALFKSFEVDEDAAKCVMEVIHYRTKAKITVEIDPVWKKPKKEEEPLDNSNDVPESDDDAGCCC